MSPTPSLTDLEFRLLNDWQRGFPLKPRPYAELATCLGSDEASVLAALADLGRRGHISRIGAVFRPHVLGTSTLAALACPPARVDAVAARISALPEVNHNYQREHRYNLWFVITAPSRRHIDQTLADLQRDTGLTALDLPMLEDYHIDLGFDLARDQGSGIRRRGPHLEDASRIADAGELRAQLESADYVMVAALEGGLPLEPRPYARLATRCGLSEAEVLTRIGRLIELGVIRRFGVVVRHRELGYTANAMVVWDVPDNEVDSIGRRLAREPAVSLCYRRPRRLPEWPYNLFTMLHGRDRVAVLAELEALRRRHDLAAIPCEALFSVRRFKQCGASYASLAKAA